MADLKTDFNASHRHTFAFQNYQAYTSGGDWDKVHVFDPSESNTAREAGIQAAPTDWAPSPGSGSGDNPESGTHLMRYRYLDRRTGYVGNPSNIYSLTASGVQTYTFAIDAPTTTNIQTSTDSKVTHIILEATTAGGTEFYQVGILLNDASLAFDYNIVDAVLSLNTFDYATGASDHTIPPYAQIIHSHRGIMFFGGGIVYATGTVTVTNGNAGVTGASSAWTQAAVGRWFQVDGDTRAYRIITVGGATSITLEENYAGTTGGGKTYTIYRANPNIVYHSLPLYPQSVPPLYFTNVLQETGDRLRALVSFGSDLLIVGEANMELWSYTAIPSEDGAIHPVPGNRGTVWHDCVEVVEGIAYGLDRQGVWAWAGEGAPRPISQKIDDHFIDSGEIDWDYADRFHTCWIPGRREVRFFYVPVGETYPTKALCYEVDHQRWSVSEYAMAIGASRTIVSAKRLRPVFGDENGYEWWGDTGPTDGAEPSSTTSAVVDTGATQTSIPTKTGGLYTGNNGLAGAPVYWREGAETAIISSNTATTLTLASPGFSSGPAEDDLIEIGRINAKLKTKAIALRSLEETQVLRYLHLFWLPKAALTGKRMLLRLYLDYSATAFAAWTADSSGKEGVTLPAGTSDIEIDLGKTEEPGYARVPMPAEACRVVEFEFELVDSNIDLEFYGWKVDGETDEYETLE